MQIDLVYLWCDGNDEEFKSQKSLYSGEVTSQYSDNIGECRYRDNHELRYSLRSVAKNAPWINHIFIVTNGQIPQWLDVNNPKISIISHQEIMPSEALPTFNSEAIESCIPNIPGLAEHFLYANDDMFIFKPVSPDYFFDESGNPIIRVSNYADSEGKMGKQLYFKNIKNTLKLSEQKYGKWLNFQPTHNIDAYRKSYFLECINTFKEEFNKVCFQRFRAENSAQRFLVSLFMINEYNCKYRLFDKKRQKRENLMLYSRKSRNLQDKLRKYKPYLFCLNDNQLASDADNSYVEINLNKVFKEKQEWEKYTDVIFEPTSNLKVLFTNFVTNILKIKERL